MKKFFGIILIVISWQSCFSNEYDKMKLTAWKSIQEKFTGYRNDVVLYRNDINVKLEGNFTSEDSTIFLQLFSQLHSIIPYKINLTSGVANLVFNFTNDSSIVDQYFSNREGQYYYSNDTSILYRKTTLNVPKHADYNYRRKVLYFNLYQSLVYFSPSKSAITTIEGCVFDEIDPDKITYSSYDTFILKILYAGDFKEQLAQVRKISYRDYLVKMYPNELQLIFDTFKYLIPMLLITFLLAKRVFKSGHQSWSQFIVQGFLVIAVIILHMFIGFLADLSISDFELQALLKFIGKALIALILTFLIERLIYKKRDLGGNRVLVTFLVTSVIVTLFALSYTDTTTLFRWRIFYVLSWLIIPIGRSLFIYLNDHYNSMINQKDVELARLAAMHKQSELQSLQAKINPHFLYNALNSIASLASTDVKKTEQMALGLSDFFKYSINREQKQLNSLSEELNAIRTYLEIEKIRFGERLTFKIDCPTELLNVEIPQLLIQPLVENAIKHGLSKITENGLIRISVNKEENLLKIRVYDNGPAFPEGPLGGYGIQNTQERIALFYGKKASIKWYNGKEKYIELCLLA